LKDEARPYLTAQDANGRGWEQQISVLNQARAHNYLVDQGCSRVCFIPRAKQKTPDLGGELNGQKVVCEVKTINISEAKVETRRAGNPDSTRDFLDTNFFEKLDSTLLDSKCHINAYDGQTNTKHIVFMVINFDDGLGEYKANYFAQIDQHLAA
jgi:hypothetical protein